ncbi:hypothetical protein [Nostoc sp.]|uniref:hypothetical protein n=1 Tax=Nostoc sp. TaxID=1180 RepID=UPI002FF4D034
MTVRYAEAITHPTKLENAQVMATNFIYRENILRFALLRQFPAGYESSVTPNQ